MKGAGSRRAARGMLGFATAASVLLAGCATEPASVEDRSLGAPLPVAPSAPPRIATLPDGSYRVERGDTLYAIAFRHGVDYRDVAAWNGIAAPYKIFVGQTLRLGPPAGMRASAEPAPIASAPPPTPASRGAAASIAGGAAAVAASPAPRPASSGALFEDVSSAPPPPPPPARAAPAAQTPAPPPAEDVAAHPAPPPAVAAVPPPAPLKAAPEPPPAPLPARAASDAASASVSGISWRWPSAGKLLGGYIGGDQTKQGLDIGGNAGDAVNAAADGEVVYSGNGLIGYGELIIVKHNATFLSAYGHNRKRLVQEGDKVRAGQQIAEMGSSASARDELHFEIRKNGKPVNPLDYLPAR